MIFRSPRYQRAFICQRYFDLCRVYDRLASRFGPDCDWSRHIHTALRRAARLLPHEERLRMLTPVQTPVIEAA